MQSKLICAMIGDHCGDELNISFESVINGVDKLVFVWGMEDIHTKELVLKWKDKYPNKIVLIERRYEQELKEANGRARNAYLEFLKENFMGEYALILDPDEIIDDIGKLRIKINQIANIPEIKDKYQTLHPRMRHLINDLGHEDATRPIHYCVGRIFKIKPKLRYPEIEHPIISAKLTEDDYKTEEELYRYVYTEWINEPVIWHLGYAKNIFNTYNKYKTHMKKSNIHSKEYLKNWRNAHLFGTYPTSLVHPLDIPKQLREYFCEEVDDEFYFKDRMNLEIKHFLDAITIKRFFNLNNYSKILDIGCGAAQRVFTLQTYGIDAYGADCSKYIIDKMQISPVLNNKLFVDNIINWQDIRKWDLIITYDLLEHISYENIDKVLEKIYEIGNKYFFFAITMKGNPNLEKDNTHIIKESKDWWIDKLNNKGFIVAEAPKDFAFYDNILIATKNENDILSLIKPIEESVPKNTEVNMIGDTQ